MTPCWLWPNHVIGKRESGGLREEHNALVNEAESLREAGAALAHIDSWLARRTALDGFKTRAEKLAHILAIAAENDPKGLLSAIQVERDELRVENTQLREANDALRAAERDAREIAQIARGERDAAVESHEDVCSLLDMEREAWAKTDDVLRQQRDEAIRFREDSFDVLKAAYAERDALREAAKMAIACADNGAWQFPANGAAHDRAARALAALREALRQAEGRTAP